jgi:hypothetical protein
MAGIFRGQRRPLFRSSRGGRNGLSPVNASLWLWEWLEARGYATLLAPDYMSLFGIDGPVILDLFNTFDYVAPAMVNCPNFRDGSTSFTCKGMGRKGIGGTGPRHRFVLDHTRQMISKYGQQGVPTFAYHHHIVDVSQYSRKIKCQSVVKTLFQQDALMTSKNI